MALPLLARLIADGDHATVMGILTDPRKTGRNFKRTVAAGDHQAIIEAARYQDHAKLIEALIGHGANPRARHHEPLRQAVLNANTRNITALIEHGYQSLTQAEQAADPISTDIIRTALETCPEKTVLRILELEVRVDSYSLSFAVLYEMEDVVEALLEKGADPNLYTSDLPLPLAARSNFLKIGEMLLKHGADPFIRSSRGANEDRRSALEFARERGHGEFVALLERHQANTVRPVLEQEMQKLAAPGAPSWF